jgi:hypothetical protein
MKTEILLVLLMAVTLTPRTVPGTQWALGTGNEGGNEV